MPFNPWEWIRLVCYACAAPAAIYLALRAGHRHDAIFALLWCGFALLFGWYLFDLTMVSLGVSSRETRNFGTPITVFATGGVVSLALRELRVQWSERRLRAELTQLTKTLNGVQH